MDETPNALMGRRFVRRTFEFLDCIELIDVGKESALLWNEFCDELPLSVRESAVGATVEGTLLVGGGES